MAKKHRVRTAKKKAGKARRRKQSARQVPKAKWIKVPGVGWIAIPVTQLDAFKEQIESLRKENQSLRESLRQVQFVKDRILKSSKQAQAAVTDIACALRGAHREGSL